ncbi:glycosyltransferase family 2 protein [Chlorogloea sp. CCALA 695]|uniref:glycosyltransferase family 2 protein n=1 Tax=Chlorogloea sp. CCALA 695 TaxID=2107693 RepID=UPI000D05A5B0|nr:glycosyltransferase [Chlorogloea sp. CCALA 695]PSB31103.1 glycosyl transferase family A [Chlorogloea sp. CCALA 695]
MPTVTVIIPTYNTITYLPKTLESVLNQTFTDFEIIIIDDGSTDTTAKWLGNLVEPRIKIVVQTNQGVAVARNKGIALASGKYIAFLDSDDLWEPTKLEKQVQCLDADPAVGLVNTWIKNIDEQGNDLVVVRVPEAEGNVWNQIIEENLILCGSVPMIRRSSFEEVGVFDCNLLSAEDWDMWIRLAAKYSFALIKEPLVSYRQHLKSKSNNLEKHLSHRLKVIDKTFLAAPPQMQHLKNRAVGRAYLAIAWKLLLQKDYKAVNTHRQKALTYSPELRKSDNYKRLTLLSWAKQWLGEESYARLRSLIGKFKKPSVIGS